MCCPDSDNWPAQVLHSLKERRKSEISPAQVLAANKTDLTRKSVWQYSKNTTELFFHSCITDTKLNSSDLFHKTYSREIMPNSRAVQCSAVADSCPTVVPSIPHPWKSHTIQLKVTKWFTLWGFDKKVNYIFCKILTTILRETILKKLTPLKRKKEKKIFE